MKNAIFLISAVVALSCLYNCKKDRSPSSPFITLISPANKATVAIDKLNFTWTSKGDTNYLIQIASDTAFSNIIDSASIHNTAYYSAVQDYWEGNKYVTNYILGQTYYWRILFTDTKIISAINSFTIMDVRNNFEGRWNGRFHLISFFEPNKYVDTTYNDFVMITSNNDGTISVSPDMATGNPTELLPSSNSYYFIGSVQCYGSHEGQICTFDSTFHNLIFISGNGGEGGCSTDSFISTR